jgi:hypothetical protein
MVRQPGSHRWCAGAPRLGRARAVCRQGLRQTQAYTGVRQAKVIVDVVKAQLLAEAAFALTQGLLTRA